MKSVNALNGLLLISSVSDYVEEIVEKLCQCPQRASTYFFYKSMTDYITDVRVSMPSTGFYLFLPVFEIEFVNAQGCVNALNGLLLISSGIKMSEFRIYHGVNALNGLLLISSAKEVCSTMMSMILCQCPQRASTYFFLLVAHMDTVHKECVSMPSTGFYLFLQHKRNNGTDSQCSVSMPSTGFYLFLQIKKSPGGAERGMCQCPQRASTYFFDNNEKRNRNC